MYSPSILQQVQKENPLCPLTFKMKLLAEESQQKTLIITLILTEFTIMQVSSSVASETKSNRNHCYNVDFLCHNKDLLKIHFLAMETQFQCKLKSAKNQITTAF